jgi:hypothetical protein
VPAYCMSKTTHWSLIKFEIVVHNKDCGEILITFTINQNTTVCKESKLKAKMNSTFCVRNFYCRTQNFVRHEHSHLITL